MLLLPYHMYVMAGEKLKHKSRKATAKVDILEVAFRLKYRASRAGLTRSRIRTWLQNPPRSISIQIRPVYSCTPTDTDWITCETGLHPSHNHFRQQILRSRHNWSAAEEQAHVVEFKYVGFVAEFRSIVDARAVLLEGCVAAHIFWRMGIDRYLEEGAASAAQGF